MPEKPSPTEKPIVDENPSVDEKPTTEAEAPVVAAPKGGKKAEARAKEATATATAPLSPEAAKDLQEAEAALDAGKPSDALRLAQHSLYAQKSSRAYALIARARCAQGDLGNAKAALAQVAARDRAAVIRACGKLNVELR